MLLNVCVGIWAFTTALERFFSRNGNLLHHSNDTIQKISQTSTSSPSSFFYSLHVLHINNNSAIHYLMFNDRVRFSENIRGYFVCLVVELPDPEYQYMVKSLFFLKCMAPPSTNAKLLRSIFIQDQKFRVTRTQKTKF